MKNFNYIIIAMITISTSSLAQMQAEGVENSKVINVSARKAWNLIKDFRNLPLLLPNVERTEVIGKGKKASWTIYLDNGAVIKEVTTAFSNRKMTMSYLMTETPMPLQNYQGTFEVVSLDKNRCEVYFKTTFESLQKDKEQLLNTFREVQLTFLGNIELSVIK
ncbi:MAG: SRPBCC family protein [Bacteroidota bacterium]